MNERTCKRLLQMEQCTIDVDPHKNRLHVNIHGACDELSNSSHVLEELHELKHHLSRGFTMLVDVSQAHEESQWENALHDVLNLLFEGGIRKIAEVRSAAIRSRSPEGWSSEQIMPGVHLQRSPTREEAERWLDA